MDSIETNLTAVRAQVQQALIDAGRVNDSLTVLAVSKTRAAGELEAAFNQGQRDFGENYLQESLEKISALEHLDITWHFIGPIQSNKTRPIAENFAWVHSVDREKIGRRLAEQRPPGLPPLNICLQVNISGEASKSGCLPEQLEDLAAALDELPQLQVRGLMAIPQVMDDYDQQRAVFAKVKALFLKLQQRYPHFDTLSMGMSGDMAAAIAEGASIVRIGTAIFGPRNYNK